MTHSPELLMLKCYDLSSCYRESWRISSISNIKIKVLDSTLLFYFILFSRNIIFNNLYSNNKSNVFLKRKHWQRTSFLRWGHFYFSALRFLYWNGRQSLFLKPLISMKRKKHRIDVITSKVWKKRESVQQESSPV